MRINQDEDFRNIYIASYLASMLTTVEMIIKKSIIKKSIKFVRSLGFATPKELLIKDLILRANARNSMIAWKFPGSVYYMVFVLRRVERCNRN